MIRLKWSLVASSRLWDRTQRSCLIPTVTVVSVGFSGHGVSTTVDTSDSGTRVV